MLHALPASGWPVSTCCCPGGTVPVWPGVGLTQGVLAKPQRLPVQQDSSKAAAGTEWWVAAQAFAQTLQQSRGFGSEFRFPDAPAGATTPAGQAAAAGTQAGFANGAADDDDDLYS